MRHSSGTTVTVLLGLSLVTVAACGGDGDEGGGSEGGGAVEIIGAPGGASGAALEAEMARISEETGLDVTYTQLPDFDTVIQSRVRGNDAPDIALFPQPGVMLDLAQGGDLVPLDDVVDVEAIGDQMIPGLIEIAELDGSTYGIAASINVKSLVWSPAGTFGDGGREIPATHQELVAVTEEIEAEGTPPWCFAFESSTATGWYVTDWIEEYVLRIGGPEVYDQWVTHEIPFNDPIVKEAALAFEELVLADGNAVLNRQAMGATPWGDGMAPLVTDPPGCYMARQGNFITGFWPEEVQSDLPTYVDTFLLPPYEGGWDGGQPVLGGGDLVGIFDAENEDVVTVLEAIFTPEFGAQWAEGGEFISPYPEFDSANYTSETLGDVAALVAEADAFRFDGSDLMPGQVGSGSFWTEMTAWVTGQTDLDTALANIDASWPTE